MRYIPNNYYNYTMKMNIIYTALQYTVSTINILIILVIYGYLLMHCWNIIAMHCINIFFVQMNIIFLPKLNVIMLNRSWAFNFKYE